MYRYYRVSFNKSGNFSCWKHQLQLEVLTQSQLIDFIFMRQQMGLAACAFIRKNIESWTMPSTPQFTDRHKDSTLNLARLSSPIDIKIQPWRDEIIPKRTVPSTPRSLISSSNLLLLYYFIILRCLPTVFGAFSSTPCSSGFFVSTQILHTRLPEKAYTQKGR